MSGLTSRLLTPRHLEAVASCSLSIDRLVENAHTKQPAIWENAIFLQNKKTEATDLSK